MGGEGWGEEENGAKNRDGVNNQTRQARSVELSPRHSVYRLPRTASRRPRCPNSLPLGSHACSDLSPLFFLFWLVHATSPRCTYPTFGTLRFELEASTETERVEDVAARKHDAPATSVVATGEAHTALDVHRRANLCHAGTARDGDEIASTRQGKGDRGRTAALPPYAKAEADFLGHPRQSTR